MTRNVYKAPLELRVWDREKKALYKHTYYGRNFVLEGVAVKLFPVRVLARAIDRTSTTIALWEREGRFPKPMWSVAGSNTKRWYSSAQLQALNSIANEYHTQGRSRRLRVDEMLERFRKAFYTADMDKMREDERYA